MDNPRADGGLSVVTGPDQELYELVTQYVREEMNRADRLKAPGEGRRSNTVGFALTILQRRLAARPEAIWRSLERRRKRLERPRQKLTTTGGRAPSSVEQRLTELLGPQFGRDDHQLDDELEELAGDELEELEEDVADAATAARTAAELDIEITQLKGLEGLARRVQRSGRTPSGPSCGALLTDDDAVVAIHGGTRGEERRKVRELFTQDKDVAVL